MNAHANASCRSNPGLLIRGPYNADTPKVLDTLSTAHHSTSPKSDVSSTKNGSCATVGSQEKLRLKENPGESESQTAQALPCHPATDSGFSRYDSLLNFGVSPARNSSELKSLLGSSNSRLKPGATISSLYAGALDKEARKAHAVSLEQAKARARIEVDLALETNCCVQTGYMRGNVKIRVRKRQKKEAPVLIADGKLSIVGFETTAGASNHHTFYHRVSPLSSVTDAYARLCDSPPDAEGFSRAIEGVHTLPFAMLLSVDDAFGVAKGSPCLQSGVTIRYIVMISVKVKDSKSGKRSIAHSYRDCQIWPRIDPVTVLASAPRPIQASTCKCLSVMGSDGKLKLTAALNRLTWISGQRCFVYIWIVNETKKSVKSISLTLVRTTTVFKPKSEADAEALFSESFTTCRSSTTHKVVAESILERSHAVAKGHASAEGWWNGVQAGQERHLSHHLLVPMDALSVPRSRFVEVEYSIRVSVSAGALTPDVHVTLPVHIINFISIDPSLSAPLLAPDGSYARVIPFHQVPAEGQASTEDKSHESGRSGHYGGFLSSSARDGHRSPTDLGGMALRNSCNAAPESSSSPLGDTDEAPSISLEEITASNLPISSPSETSIYSAIISCTSSSMSARDEGGGDHVYADLNEGTVKIETGRPLDGEDEGDNNSGPAIALTRRSNLYDISLSSPSDFKAIYEQTHADADTNILPRRRPIGARNPGMTVREGNESTASLASFTSPSDRHEISSLDGDLITNNDNDEGATARLGELLRSRSAFSSTADLGVRPLRELPRPPSQTRGIPASVSALAALRMSRMQPAVSVPVPGLPPSDISPIATSRVRAHGLPAPSLGTSALSMPPPPASTASTAFSRRTLPTAVSDGVVAQTTPAVLPSGEQRRPLVTRQRGDTLPATSTDKTGERGSVRALRKTGQSGSPVKDRIAALEARLRDAGGVSF